MDRKLVSFVLGVLAVCGLSGCFLAGCGSSPDYTEVPVSKLPAGTAPTQPPPPPPGGATASGNAPRYSETGATPSAPGR